eukprot:Pgem_evm1s915
MVTKPLDKNLLKEIGEHPVCDDRFSLSYYRKLADNRLLWGGLFAAKPINSREKQIKHLRDDMVKAYPQLNDVAIDYVWGGRMATSYEEMPIIKLKKNVWYVTGLSGHGLEPSCVVGNLISRAILSGYINNDYKYFSESFRP